MNINERNKVLQISVCKNVKFHFEKRKEKKIEDFGKTQPFISNLRILQPTVQNRENTNIKMFCESFDNQQDKERSNTCYSCTQLRFQREVKLSLNLNHACDDLMQSSSFL